MPETVQPTLETIRAAVTLSSEPDPGKTVYVKRSGKAVIPIQVIMRALRGAHPDTKFVFGPEPEGK